MHFLNIRKMNINNRLIYEHVLQKRKMTDKDNHLYLPFKSINNVLCTYYAIEKKNFSMGLF